MALREVDITKFPSFEKVHRFSHTLPATLDYRPQLMTVRNQGTEDSCVGEASACMKEWQENQSFGLEEYMSPQFVYNCRPNYPSDGMYLSDAMNILTTLGCPLERTYNYGIIQHENEIPAAAMTEAAYFKISSNSYITTSAGLQQALVQNGVCIISFPIYNNSTTFWVQGSGQSEEGGHCVAVVGYTADSFILRNSWGASWGSDGYTMFPFSQWDLHWDCFTSVNLPTTYRPSETPYVPPDVASSSSCCGKCGIQ